MKTLLAESRVRRIAVLAAVNLMLAVGGYLALVAPQKSHASAAQQAVLSVQSQLRQIAAVTTPVAPKQPVIHTADIYALDHAMPVTEDQPDLLLTVDQLARDANVRVITLSPSTPAQAAGYTTLPISLTIGGTYRTITDFMHGLEALVTVRHRALLASGRLFSVTNVAIAPGSGGGPPLTGTLTIDAFVFGSVAGATPLPVAATATSTGTGTTSTTSTTSTTTTSG